MLTSRIAAVALALFWGMLFFGLIDLVVVPLQDHRFYDFYLLETGWGLLYTVLVAVPLVAFAFRPRHLVPLQQLVVVAAAVLLGGLAALAVRQVVPAVLLATTAMLLSRWSKQRLWPIDGLSLRGADPWLAALVLPAVVGAGLYAARMAHAARIGVPDDDTWWLTHLPMQASFGVALAGSAAVAVFAGGARAPGRRLAAVPAGLSAVWLGAVSTVYPTHLGSLGTAAGVAAIAWGLLFVVRAFR